MVQKLRTQMTWFCLQPQCFFRQPPEVWETGWPQRVSRCSCLLLLSSWKLPLIKMILMLIKMLWAAAIWELTRMCSKVWTPKTQQRAASLHIWGTQMDSTGSCPLPAGEGTTSPGPWFSTLSFLFEVMHTHHTIDTFWLFSFTEWKYWLLYHQIILILYAPGKGSWKHRQAHIPTHHRYTTGW